MTAGPYPHPRLKGQMGKTPMSIRPITARTTNAKAIATAQNFSGSKKETNWKQKRCLSPPAARPEARGFALLRRVLPVEAQDRSRVATTILTRP